MAGRGLKASASGPQTGLMDALAGGFGIRIFDAYRLDYAFSPSGELGNAQRISLTARF